MDAALSSEAKKRRQYPVDAAVSFNASSRNTVINLEEDSAGIRRKGLLIDAAVGEEKARDEDLPASNRESALEDTMAADDLSDVSGTVRTRTTESRGIGCL